MIGSMPAPSFPNAAVGKAGDVVVIGAGLAGVFTALELAPLPVTLVSAARFGEGASSGWAQAGVAAALGEDDSPEQHALDTILAGAGLVDARVAHLLAAEAPNRIDDLIRYGVPFDRDAAGRLVLSREAAHSRRRIARIGGDRAGQAIMAALIAAVRKTPSIRVLEGYAARALLLEDGRVSGVRIEHLAAARQEVLRARAVVLATGGIGHLYSVTTNPREARGQGLAIAAWAGAIIADAEFVQFHPTAVAIGRDPAPLATEALRGEGATLIDGTGDRFMLGLHPDAELAPRDIVAQAVHRTVMSGRGAYLDCRAAIGTQFAARFPTVHAACIAAGIDPAWEPIPIAPAAHYHMGGVATDTDGRTTVPGLWACGEVASTGAHGANRLASNSLLEAVVFGARIARDIGAAAAAPVPLPVRRDRGPTRDLDLRLTETLRRVMTRHVGVVRAESGLRLALCDIAEIEEGAPHARAEMLAVARLVVVSALLREESRGAHARSDFPETARVAERTFLTLSAAEAIAVSIAQLALPRPEGCLVAASA